MTSTTIKIADIKVGNRFRKDLGDIDSLVRTIQDVGLLQPVVINENNQLVAGQRRLEAVKRFGWKEVPCTVVNISNLTNGELIENTLRKDFSFSERQAILEEIEKQRRSKLERGNNGNNSNNNKGKRSAE